MATTVLFLAGCDPGNLNGFNPGAITIQPRTCAELRASDLIWGVGGFETADILNPDVRNPTQLTAVIRVGQRKMLTLHAGSVGSAEDCSSKASLVQWVSSNSVVARLEVGTTARSAVLEGRQPGDTSVSAVLTFQDGTPAMQVLPYAIASFGGAPVTAVRVVP